MIYKVFSVRDVKAESYLPPMFLDTTGRAVRAFEAAANKEDHDFHKWAADYTLFEIGTFDDQTCKIELLEQKRPLGTALDFIRSPLKPVVEKELRANV